MNTPKILLIIAAVCFTMPVQANDVAELESLIQTQISSARCQLTCVDVQDDSTEHERCMRVCLTGDYSVCDYDWLCVGSGCRKACKTNQHKFIFTDITVKNCRMTIPETELNRDVLYIIGAKDKNNMWRLLDGESRPNDILNLEADDVSKFLAIGVLGVSSAGIVERQTISIDEFSCGDDNIVEVEHSEDFTVDSDNLMISEHSSLYVHEVDNQEINRFILFLLTCLILICSCVLLILFSMYLKRTCTRQTAVHHDNLEESNVDSEHFIEKGIPKDRSYKQNVVKYDEIIEA